MGKSTIKTINKDHILLTAPCGCKLHVFITGEYEEPCEKHKQSKVNSNN